MTPKTTFKKASPRGRRERKIARERGFLMRLIRTCDKPPLECPACNEAMDDFIRLVRGPEGEPGT